MHLDPWLTIMTGEVYIVAHTVQLGCRARGAHGGIPTLHIYYIYVIHTYMYLDTARPAPLHTRNNIIM